ncbi:hypothetical protein ICM05_01005 [Leucobacter sp. cx-42]|uniref:hypothetical protein n=1 Tax=unclassified Leucobacter TaxID=2621730 RepID=UPI00165DF43A|nr:MULTISPECIES: hypothetical protein [unclassified Leucobacter]MBC9953226.1 hypothetical protein [Leucobacter sp. cx-42]
MSDAVVIALISGAAVVAGAAGTALGSWLTGRAQAKGAKSTARAAIKASEDTAQDRLIDQLQEELTRYRERTDRRLDALETENRGYRAFIGVQRDHMAEHKIPLPPWPDGLPR